MWLTLLRRPPRRRPNRTGSRTAPKPLLADSHWLLIADLFADPPAGPRGGRPRVPARKCLEGVVGMLLAGARWKDGPGWHPSTSACRRRHRDWTRSGVWRAAWDRPHARGIELIRPHRENRTKPPTQDGRSLKRHRHHWAAERTIRVLHSCRRVMTR